MILRVFIQLFQEVQDLFQLVTRSCGEEGISHVSPLIIIENLPPIQFFVECFEPIPVPLSAHGVPRLFLEVSGQDIPVSQGGCDCDRLSNYFLIGWVVRASHTTTLALKMHIRQGVRDTIGFFLRLFLARPRSHYLRRTSLSMR